MRRYSLYLRLTMFSLLLCCGFSSSAFAAGASSTTKTTQPDSLQSVAQSYGTATPLQQGLIVALAKNKQVEVAQYKNSKGILGVTVSSSSTPVTLSSTATGNNVYVVTSGRYNVLVTNQNGNIAAGDPVSVSALSGVGMKADTSQDSILGRAVTGFDGKTNVMSTNELTTTNGQKQKVAISSISVDINIGVNPLKVTGQNGVPKFIQNIAVGIVGKPISAAQLYASVAVIVIGIGVVASLLYGGIQTGMTAIGRNPLARKSIIRSMVQVLSAGVIIFAGCLFAVYLILKL